MSTIRIKTVWSYIWSERQVYYVSDVPRDDQWIDVILRNTQGRSLWTFFSSMRVSALTHIEAH